MKNYFIYLFCHDTQNDFISMGVINNAKVKIEEIVYNFEIHLN